MNEIAAGAIGAVVGAWLIFMLTPSHKPNCDTLGMTRFGDAAYICTPKQPSK